MIVFWLKSFFDYRMSLQGLQNFMVHYQKIITLLKTQIHGKIFCVQELEEYC